MENFDEAVRFADLIKDQDWGVDEKADAGSSIHRAADIGELLQQIDVIKDGFAESLCADGKNVLRVYEDSSKSASAASVIRILKSTWESTKRLRLLKPCDLRRRPRCRGRSPLRFQRRLQPSPLPELVASGQPFLTVVLTARGRNQKGDPSRRACRLIVVQPFVCLGHAAFSASVISSTSAGLGSMDRRTGNAARICSGVM
jgi:hypothetical protein